MAYDSLDLKKPVEAEDYEECSNFVVQTIESIMKDAMDAGRNKIIINTNLKFGIPMENVNKIAGPFIEAWAFCQLLDKKFIASKKGYNQWLEYAGQNGWIK